MDVFCVIACALLALAGYLFVRNYFVYKFRTDIIDLCHKHNLRRIGKSLIYDSANRCFLDKYSYKDMLLSFKPLKLKYWYTEEEIERLMS